MTGRERDAFEQEIYETKGKDIKINYTNFRAKLVSRCLVDAEGKRLFSDKEIDLLGGKSADALDFVFGHWGGCCRHYRRR